MLSRLVRFKQCVYLMPSTSEVKSSTETGSKTYLELIQSNLKEPSQPIVPKTKRERADENWRALVSYVSIEYMTKISLLLLLTLNHTLLHMTHIVAGTNYL